MKNLICCFFLFVFSCSRNSVPSKKWSFKDDQPPPISGSYIIYKIDSIHNWYLIYAKNSKSLFKIVSSKNKVSKDHLLQVGDSYELVLQPLLGGKIMGREANGSFWSYFPGYRFDDSTYINLERDSINNLYVTNNIIGLSLVKK